MSVSLAGVKHLFKIGDKVKCVKKAIRPGSTWELPIGSEWVVKNVLYTLSGKVAIALVGASKKKGYAASRFINLSRKVKQIKSRTVLI